MNRPVFTASEALAVLGLSGLAWSPCCNRPLEIQKGDYLLHAAPAESAPLPKPAPSLRPMPSPDPGYHPE